MSVKIFYRQDSEYTRSVTEYLHDFEHRTRKKIEEIDPDSRQGADLCRVYDIVEYPTIIAVSEDGKLQNAWKGIPLPLIDEVSFYV